VAVVNARISDRSWPRYRRLKGLWRPFLSRSPRAGAERDRRRAAEGHRLPPDRVTVAGNLKFDVRAAKEADATRLLKALAPDCASSWPAARLKAKNRRCWKPGLACSRRSQLLPWSSLRAIQSASPLSLRCSRIRHSLGQALGLALAAGRPSLIRFVPGQIVLLDTIGELASVYSLAAVAFVGGSLVPAGGHNPLEPAQFGVPIVMGPHYANFRAITEDLLAQNALRIAKKEESHKGSGRFA
jgi:3-deoxy-D-manno-octulosonic-acid transferase